MDAEDPSLNVLASQLESCLRDLAGGKVGNGKIFVAIYPEQTIVIEGNISVDVIVARLDNSKKSEVIKTETLQPLSEQDFLEHIHDTLAQAIAAGSVDLTTLNQIIKHV